MRKDLLCNANLAKAGRRLGIHGCTVSARRLADAEQMATTVEAIIGAVWLDSQRNLAAVGRVMDRFGLTSHRLLPSRPTVTHPTCYLRSSRPLSYRFFIGHHLGLLQLLFNHGQSFLVQPQPQPQQRVQHTEGLSTGLWSRLKHILNPPQPKVNTAQTPAVAPDRRQDEYCGQAPSPCESTPTEAQHAQEPVLVESALTPQQPAAWSGIDPASSLALAEGHDESTDADTDWRRINWFLWSARRVRKWPGDRWFVLERLKEHRQVLAGLPDRSLKNLPDDWSNRTTCKVRLITYSRNEPLDKRLARDTAALSREWSRVILEAQKRRLEPDELRNKKELEAQLANLWVKRLKLWLPPKRRKKAQANPRPTSLPGSDPNPASSSETPSPALPVTAAVDSTGPLIASPPDYERPQRWSPVLWVGNIAQYGSPDYKHRLEKPTGENNRSMQLQSRKVVQDRPLGRAASQQTSFD
jgi:hypothetical protein